MVQDTNCCCSTPANLCESPPVIKETITCTKDCVTYQSTRIKNADDVTTYKRLVGSTCCSTEDLDSRGSQCCTPQPCGLSFTSCEVSDRVAGWYRGTENFLCHAYGTVPMFIREIPEAGIFVVNHEFVELVVQSIGGYLNSCNLGQSTYNEVRKYARLYLDNSECIDDYGKFDVNDIIGTEEYFNNKDSIKRDIAILKAIEDNLKGKLYGCNES